MVNFNQGITLNTVWIPRRKLWSVTNMHGIAKEVAALRGIVPFWNLHWMQKQNGGRLSNFVHMYVYASCVSVLKVFTPLIQMQIFKDDWEGQSHIWGIFCWNNNFVIKANKEIAFASGGIPKVVRWSEYDPCLWNHFITYFEINQSMGRNAVLKVGKLASHTRLFRKKKQQQQQHTKFLKKMTLSCHRGYMNPTYWSTHVKNRPQ